MNIHSCVRTSTGENLPTFECLFLKSKPHQIGVCVDMIGLTDLTLKDLLEFIKEV